MKVKYYYFVILLIVVLLSLFFLKKTFSFDSKNRIMSVGEFKKAINDYEFFKKTSKTTEDQPLDSYEVEMINEALKHQNDQVGGVFDDGRNINSFTGDTLLVGGGKARGAYGENQGKTILYDFKEEEEEIDDLIKNLSNAHWPEDPHTGKKFRTRKDRKSYIETLNRKKRLYKKAYDLKNKDILERYFTLNIDKNIKPDFLGSITSISDMEKIPDNKFKQVEFENVPCYVFLHPKLYTILERITKPSGDIKLSVNNACRRLIAPVISKTKFSEEYRKQLEENFELLESLHPTYHRITLTIKNEK